MISGNLFMVPKYIISGENAIVKAGEFLFKMGKKPLIVTDNMMISLKLIDKVVDTLKKIGMEYVIYSEVNSEPTDTIVVNGAEIYKNSNCDFLIGFGGGSPIDAMKAISVLVTSDEKINSYIGKEISHKLPPLIAIPTTAGTGSESTQFTIITDTVNGVKMLLKGPELIPTLAIVDPYFTLTSPKHVTSSTGIDALTHAIEAYTSIKAQPLSDVYALSAVKRIFKNIRIAYNEGSNIEARTQMAIAALEGGIAFNNASVTIVHGMSRPIGALFHVPHGLSNAMLISNCLEFALEGAVERFATLAEVIGIDIREKSNIEAAKMFLNEVTCLCKDLNVMTLEEFGVNREEFFDSIPKMVKDAIISGSPNNTRRIPTEDDLASIYKSLW